MSLVQLTAGLVLGALIGGLAQAAGTLTRGGAAAAALVGGLTFGVGGIGSATLLLAFFVSSSGFSRVGVRRKEPLARRAQRGSRRDESQVLANGLLPALLSIGFGLTGQTAWLVGIAGALAASNADTWATELGVLAGPRPRLMTTGRPVARGTSGGVSLLGSLAGLAGALWIGGFAGGVAEALLQLPRPTGLRLAVASGVGGLLGGVLDSLLGATVQSSYRCLGCGEDTEHHPRHLCGGATELIRGWSWLGNDAVNLLASAGGAGLALLLWIGLSGPAD